MSKKTLREFEKILEKQERRTFSNDINSLLIEAKVKTRIPAQENKICGAECQVRIDPARIEKSIKSGFVTVPDGLSKEELFEFMFGN